MTKNKKWVAKQNLLERELSSKPIIILRSTTIPIVVQKIIIINFHQ